MLFGFAEMSGQIHLLMAHAHDLNRYATLHRADLRLRAMKASKSSGLAGPERSPASSAERNA